MSSCLIIQHVEPEVPYAIGDALDAAGVDLEVRRVFLEPDLPGGASGFDGLVVMGGPMSAYNDEGFPTRAAELELIADAVRRGIPMLGVCLGAQLLALASGGNVFEGTRGLEVGWAPVRLSGDAQQDALLSGMPDQLTVFHWHGDTYALGSDSVRLATNSMYAEQAFRVGPRAWGFQFHLEVDDRAIAAFLQAFGSEALGAGTTPDEIAAQSAGSLEILVPQRTRILDRFADLVANREREDIART